MATNNCETCADTTNLPATPACPPATPCPPRLCAPQEWTCGGWLYKELDGCTTRTRLAGVLPDGVYTNPIVEMVNGCMKSIKSGTNIIQSRPEPCATGAGSVTPVANITISPAPCNLLSGSASALFAGITFNQAGQNITVTGCGTPTSPLVISANAGSLLTSIASTTLQYSVSPSGAVSINTQGANYSKCGTVIESGIVKTYSDTIKTIIGQFGIKATYDAATCKATLEFDWKTAKLPSRTISGVSCGGAFVDPATGTPPALGVWASMPMTVYGSRLQVNAPYPVVLFNSAGTNIGNIVNGYIDYGTPDVAHAALNSIYSFAGSGAC
jgi:hypothetical protein